MTGRPSVSDHVPAWIPEDIAKTVYAAMGIDNLEPTDREGRPFDLLPEGRAIRELL